MKELTLSELSRKKTKILATSVDPDEHATNSLSLYEVYSSETLVHHRTRLSILMRSIPGKPSPDKCE